MKRLLFILVLLLMTVPVFSDTEDLNLVTEALSTDNSISDRAHPGME